MTTIAEIYNLPPVHKDFLDFSNFNGCYYKHIPEIQEGEIDYSSIPKNSPLRIVIHGLYDERDGRRFWVIWSAWFEDKPFMLMRNAGREGDDSAKRYVTNSDLYYKAIIYLKSFSNRPLLNNEVVDKDKDIINLTNFYGHSLESSYHQHPPLKIEK